MPSITNDFPVFIDRLSKIYRSHFPKKTVHALKEVTLEVSRGEVFGLLGPNGAGKTTLVKILLDLVRRTEGGVYLFGLPSSDAQARWRVGYLPENHHPPDFLTPVQMLQLMGRLSHLENNILDTRIPQLLERVGVASWKRDKIGQFSKGMKQRLGMAQVLLNHPELIILDEPTDGVDPIGRRDIRDLIKELKDQGTTVFLNSHQLSEVEQVCTRIAILDKGSLIYEGSVSDLTSSGAVFDVTSTPIPPSIISELNGVVEIRVPQDPNDGILVHYRIKATDRSHLNTILDQLRIAQVEFESIHPVRKTLEESFIELLCSDNRHQV